MWQEPDQCQAVTARAAESVWHVCGTNSAAEERLAGHTRSDRGFFICDPWFRLGVARVWHEIRRPAGPDHQPLPWPGRLSRAGVEGCHQRRHLDGGDDPDLLGIHPVLMVGEHDAQAGDVTPRDVGVPARRHVRKRRRGLTDDLQQPLRSPTQDWIGEERLMASGHHLGKFGRAVQDVGEPLVV